MKELMVHVERIVRPVRAFESRKLRMRRELLGHLLSALEEEQRANPDEPGAIDLAKERLGDPTDLTQQLQRAVPRVERILLAPMVSPAMERWEARGAQRLYGVKAMSQLHHMSILSAAAGLLSGIPAYIEPVRNSLTNSGISPIYPRPFFLSLLILFQVIFVLSLRFVVGAADPSISLAMRPTARRALWLVGLHALLALLLYHFGLDRLPTPLEMAGNLFVTTGMLTAAFAVARWVARLRRPYEDWLTLDIAT